MQSTCSECGTASEAASLHHRVRRLPRVLVLHLKRFALDPVTFDVLKRHDVVTFPSTLTLGTLRSCWRLCGRARRN